MFGKSIEAINKFVVLIQNNYQSMLKSYHLTLIYFILIVSNCAKKSVILNHTKNNHGLS